MYAYHRITNKTTDKYHKECHKIYGEIIDLEGKLAALVIQEIESWVNSQDGKLWYINGENQAPLWSGKAGKKEAIKWLRNCVFDYLEPVIFYDGYFIAGVNKYKGEFRNE